MKRFLLPLSISILGLSLDAMASSYTLPYGGRLLTPTGRPLRGPISISVNFYATGTGGNFIATQGFPSVPLQDGLFNLTIELTAAAFENVFSSSEVWIEIVDNTNGKIYPRQKFGAVPFAFKVPTDGLTLGYDASGKLRVQGLGPAALPSGNPSDGQILKWKDGTGWEWGADESGGSGSAVDSTAIVDGTISNVDIAANAAIAGSKIAPNFGAQNIATTGTITGDGSGLTNLPAGPLGTSIDGSEIAAGSITDTHIAAGAAIDASKINGLSAALAAREGTITAGTAAQYFKGDKTWATLDTSAVPENVNLYYTDTRARSALSANAPLSYNSTTGAFTISSASGVSAGTISAAEYLSFSAKQAAITTSSTINTGSLTTAQQMAVEINPYGTNAGESSELRFKELAAAGTNYVGFKAPDTLAANQIYVLPPTDGSGGQFLSTDGAGNLSWGSVVGGSGGTVTSITAGTGLTGGTITGAGTINLANTAVSAGSYSRANITVDAQGRLTAAANGGNVDLTSDITGILPLANGGTGATTAALARTALSAASSGANSDISSITGLTTALSLAQGGTGATTAPLARTALSAAASGANSDITSISGLTTALSLAQGGTGATTAPLARAALSVAASGANSDITSITGLTTALSLAQGGTGATTAPLARAALSAAASGANSDITSLTGLTTALSLAQGGTGATTAGDSRTALGLGGLATLNSVTTTQITDATIANADISGSAAIAQSKIADLTSDLSTLSSGVAGKEAAITAGTTAQYWRGDKSWQTLDSSIVAENTNLYFTDARSRGAVSATAPLSYNSGTGAFSMPSATSVANGYLSSGDWLAFNNKQAAISGASTVNTGTLTTALQNGLSLNPFGTNAGETGEIRFNELVANGSEYVGFKAPSAITATRIWTLPAADGSTGQVLSTNGTGTLTWISPGGGGTVTSITAGTGLTGGAITGAGTIDLADTAVSAGSYTRANITVDAQGRLTAAANGGSVDLTSDITGTLPLANGGTGATTAALARAALNAAASGANSDITSITGLTTALSLSQGGTGATTAADARTAFGAAASGANSDITSLTGLTTAISIAQGGTGGTTQATARSALGLGSLATLSEVGSTEITDDSVANIDISASAAIDASKIADGTVSSAEFQYINSLSSNAQTQIDAKASAANPTFTGVISSPLGAVGAPSYTFTGDLNTGMWSSAADKLDFSTAGANRLTIAASGNVGIGTTDPFTKLDVTGSTTIKASPTSVLTGSINPTASTTLTGVGTLFTSELAVGDRITVSGETRSVTAIASNTSLTVSLATTNTPNDATPDRLPAAFVVKDSANAVKLVVDDAGSLGIGTTSPARTLDVNGQIVLSNDNGWNQGGIRFRSLNGTIDAAIVQGINGQLIFRSPANDGNSGYGFLNSAANASLVNILDNGNIGIGTASPAYKLHLTGPDFNLAGPHLYVTTSADSYPIFQQLNWGHDNISHNFDMYYDGTWRSSNSGSNFQIYKINNRLNFNYASGVAAGSPISYGTALAIQNNGYIGIGTTSPSVSLDVQSSAAATVSNFGYYNPGGYGYYSGSSVGVNVSIKSSGRMVAPEFNATSDRRIKENIVDISEEQALTFLDKSRPVHYRWKTGEKNENFGFIAQEVHKLGFPELVSLTEDSELAETIDDDGFLSPAGIKFNMNYSQIIAILTKGMQVMRRDWNDFIVRITGLEDKMEKLSQENQELKMEVSHVKELLCPTHPESKLCSKEER